MKKQKIRIALLLCCIAIGAAGTEITMEALTVAFNQELIKVARDDHIEINVIQDRIGQCAEATYGKHPELLRKEAETLLRALPEYDTSLLKNYKERYILKKDELSSSMHSFKDKDRNLYLAVGWDPTRVALFSRQLLLGKALPVKQFAKMTMLSNLAKYKIYCFRKDNARMLLLEFLGDIFVCEYTLSKEGLLIPVELQWMQPLSLPDQKSKTSHKR
jgi:hypothetical protein